MLYEKCFIENVEHFFIYQQLRNIFMEVKYSSELSGVTKKRCLQ